MAGGKWRVITGSPCLPSVLIRRVIGGVNILFLIVALLGAPLPQTSAAPATELLWDTWGVPHIFAQDDESLFYAFGWAQMQSHGERILHLYAQARGRGAEWGGAAYLAGDQTIHLLGIPALGAQWYDAQSPVFQRQIDAFVAGLNAYATQHPAAVGATRALLPVTGADVFRHLARLAALLAAENSECRALLPGLSLTTSTQRSAAAWAVAPTRSANGHALLLANLHWPWDGELTLYEAHLVTPALNLSGVALVGLPVLMMGFTEQLGWTHTLSAVDRCDLYALTRAGKTGKEGYRFDGRVEPITTITQTIGVRQTNGDLQAMSHVVWRAQQGPVVEQDGQWVALRLAGLTALPAVDLLAQWWAMGKATDWVEFQQAIGPHALPFFNLIYADDQGQIAAVAGGGVPLRRPLGATDWRLPVPGDRAALVWTSAQPQVELPQVINPPAGWVQSTGGTPWYMTLPPLNPATYPRYPAPAQLSATPDFLREQGALKFLHKAGPLTLDDLATVTTNTRSELADRILDELITAANRSTDATAQAAATVLAQWDRQANTGSRGTALFARWQQYWVAQTFMKLSAANPMLHGAEQLLDSTLFYATPWEPQAPLDTPQGLFSPLVAVRALSSAAHDLRRLNLPLAISWGEVARLQRDQTDLPAHGGSSALGSFFALDFAANDPSQPGIQTAVAGAAYLAVIEFDRPLRGVTLMSHGNASQRGSPHRTDQLPLAAHRTLRPLLRTRREIEANVATRISLPGLSND